MAILIKSGYETTYANLLKEFPFCEIKTVQDGNNKMVFFPKTYVKYEGSGGAGLTIKFSDKKKDSDWRLHKSFYKFNSASEEVENGVLHSAYIATNLNGVAVSNGGAQWGGLGYVESRNKAKAAGTDYDMLNVYDYHFRGLLMLAETLAMGYTGADVQTAIGGADGAMGVTHFDIKDIWGGTDRGLWIYGIDRVSSLSGIHSIANTNLHILGIDGNMYDTGLTPSSGYPVTFYTKYTDKYDLRDLLLGATVDGTAANGSCGDYSYLGDTGYCFTSYWSSAHSGYGPFYFNRNSPTNSDATLSFGLRKSV